MSDAVEINLKYMRDLILHLMNLSEPSKPFKKRKLSMREEGLLDEFIDTVKPQKPILQKTITPKTDTFSIPVQFICDKFLVKPIIHMI